jgi:hypothetical protein
MEGWLVPEDNLDPIMPKLALPTEYIWKNIQWMIDEYKGFDIQLISDPILDETLYIEMYEKGKFTVHIDGQGLRYTTTAGLKKALRALGPAYMWINNTWEDD